MHRPIKFRIGNKETKDVIYGKYNQSNNTLEYSEGCFIADIGIIWDLMQYTGLNDRNGKRIYEGDILRRARHTSLNGGLTIVSFEYWYLCELERYNYEFKIIGNIYENPELIC